MNRWILAIVTIVVAAGSGYMATTDAGGEVALAMLRWPIPSGERSGREHVIVVLTGNTYRIPTAMRLSRQTSLPVVVAGADAEIYREQMEAERIPVRWIDGLSMDTEENAAQVACLARRHGFQRIFLVTDDSHMARAHAWFAYYQLAVTPVYSAAGFAAGKTRWTPSPEGWAKTVLAMHEWAGIAEFTLKAAARRKLPCAVAPLHPGGVQPGLLRHSQAYLASRSAPFHTPGDPDVVQNSAQGSPGMTLVR